MINLDHGEYNGNKYQLIPTYISDDAYIIVWHHTKNKKEKKSTSLLTKQNQQLERQQMRQ